MFEHHANAVSDTPRFRHSGWDTVTDDVTTMYLPNFSEGQWLDLIADFRMLQRFEHPELAQPISLSRVGDSVEMRTRCADGRLLDSVISSRSITTRALLDIVARICDVLEHAHRRGIVHGQVSPNHIVVLDEPTDDTRAQLIGMEWSRVRIHLHKRVQVAQPWVAPEIAAGGNVTPAADVYGIGAILYFWFLDGLPPRDPDATDWLREVTSEVPALAAESTLAAPLARLIGECVAIDPADRPRRASQVAARLRAAAAV